MSKQLPERPPVPARPAVAGRAPASTGPRGPTGAVAMRAGRAAVLPAAVRPAAGRPAAGRRADGRPASGLPASSLPATGQPATRHPALAPSGRGSRASYLVPVLALPIADSLGLAAAGASSPAAVSATLYALAALAALSLAGLHRLRICLRVSDQAGRILAATVLPVLLLLWLLPAPGAVRLVLISAGLVITFRLLASALLRAAHRRGLLTEPALVVGSGTFSAYLAEQLRLHPEFGLRVVGFLDGGTPRRDLPEPVLGRPGDLAEVIAAAGIRRVIVCFGDWRDEDLVAILRSCRRLHADVCVVPRLYELGLAVPRGFLDEVWGIPLVPLRQVGHGPAGLGVKRVLDISLAAIMLAAALPLLLVLAAVIRLQTGQPPLFRQLRVTGDGRQANVLKLRTITDSASSDTCWAVDSQQCTRLGRWLRALHLDGFPQLVNVLRGEMSLVGPRPERGYFADRFSRQIPRYGDRDRMAAGLTGWAQVHGLHGDTSIAERSRFDNQYIEYWSPWLDMIILIRTVGSAFSGLGVGR